MKNKLLITNLALFLAADIAVTGYILNKANRLSNEVPTFILPTVTPELEISIPELPEEIVIVENETKPIIEEKTEEIKTQAVGKITSDATLYAYPNESALDITNLCISDKVYKILSDASGYDLVKTDTNHFGFIKSDNIAYDGTTIEVPYLVTRKNDIALTTGKLNFRCGPSTDYESIRILDKETELQVLGETDNEWLMVHLNGEIGFVKKSYTKSVLDKIHEMYPALELENLDVQKIVKLRDGLNYRRGPGTEYDIIREFHFCETMRVLGEYDGWYLGITDDYEIGFVSKNYAVELNNIFIDIDILSQRMRMYNNNQLLYYTRVKTGKDFTPTDEGHFKIFWMGENVNIIDDIVVDYWMNYNNGEGIHDLASCNSYGEDDYHYAGSNGCIRTPLENVSKIYKKSSIGTPVIVHK